jgi:beta-lactamase superfamily II metal-dependent hydrolase
MHTFSKVLPALALLVLLTGCGKADTMTVVFPKIGSADAALLMTADATVLIDTGESGDGQTILDLLAEYDRDTIDLLIISHYDKDHVGGAAAVLSGCAVQRVIGSTYPKDSQEVRDFYDTLADVGLTLETCSSGMNVTLGGMTLEILPPEEMKYDQDQSNNSSLAVSVAFGDKNLLFLGDAMSQRMAELDLQADTYDLVKIPHHGRDADTTAQLLPALKSGAAAIITSSKKEPESQAVTELLEENGIHPYLTRSGDVVVTVGTEIHVKQT